MEEEKEDKKPKLHPKNKHTGRYDLDQLCETFPSLKEYVKPNKYDVESIDFSNAEAVRALNKALLMHHYNIYSWEIPKDYLCPPIPGRADYIHHVAELLGKRNKYRIPMGTKVTCLDIGTGASCIYPIIGHQEYGWKFIGTDIDEKALNSAQGIFDDNEDLKDKIDLRLQTNPKKILKGILEKKDVVDLIICNPPFHSSEADANASTLRKLKNLNGKKENKVTLNFGGKNNELWCEGGERKFISSMINESKQFAKQCLWFTTLVSKKENLKGIYYMLHDAKVENIKTINMGQGNKVSRIVAWTFLNNEEQDAWIQKRWNKKFSKSKFHN